MLLPRAQLEYQPPARDLTVGLPGSTGSPCSSIMLFTSSALSLLVACYFSFGASTGSAVVRSTFQSRCLAFAPETHIQHARRTVLEHIPAGTNLTLTDNVSSCNRASQVVDTDICRVALSIETSNRSSITFELWLPEQWSGRFLTVGNGGVDGCKSRDEASKEHH